MLRKKSFDDGFQHNIFCPINFLPSLAGCRNKAPSERPVGVPRLLVRARARLAVQKPRSVRLSSPSSVVLALVLSLEKGTQTGKTEGEEG